MELMRDRYPEDAKANGDSGTIATETLVIPHKGQDWKVTVHAVYWTLPVNTEQWTPATNLGWHHRGHAIGYLRRLANAAGPNDNATKFHIAPWHFAEREVRWQVYCEND